MRIARLEVFTASLPLARGLAQSADTVTAREAVFVRLITDTGLVGWGEVRGDLSHATGESPAGIVAALCDRLGPLVLGRTLAERGALLERFDRALVGNGAAKAALDIALHDLAARAAGAPLFQWLGGRRRPEILGSACLVCGPIDTAGADARAHVARGFRVLTLRVGLEPFERDLARVRAVREAVGDGVQLAVDANQAWTVRQAIARIRALEPFGLECVEQPLAARDLLGMAEVARSVGVPLVADASLSGLGNALTLIRPGAAGMFHVTLVTAGGLHRARQLIGVAEAARVPYVVGQMNEGMLATVAAAHLALVSAPKYADLGGADGVVGDPTPGRVHDAGRVVVPDGPGVGVAPDATQLHPACSLAL